MRGLRSVSAWILLVAIVAGGITGPVLHQVQHAAEQDAVTTARPCHASAVHKAEGAVWTGEGADFLVPECDLCARRLLVAFASPEPSASMQNRGTSRVDRRSHVASESVFTDRFIRGPPSLFEARPTTA